MTKINNLSKLLEDDLEQARLIFAARDITDRLQQMAEQIAKMSVNDVMPIIEDMKGVFGPERTDAFEQASNEALDSALESIKAAKDSLSNEILRLEGKDVPDNDMADGDSTDNEMHDNASNSESSDDDEAESIDDLFGGAESASGPKDEPLGRAKKESVLNNKKALAEKINTLRSKLSSLKG